MKRNSILIIRIVIAKLLLCLLVSQQSYGQYIDAEMTIINTHSSSVQWVDIDGDGDLDASVSGDDSDLSDGQGELIILQSKVILDTMKITPIEDGDMIWCDFNNDGIPDLLYAGDATGLTAGIDTIHISDSAYNSFYSEFTPVNNASVDWGDYDNDGDYDVLIAGDTNGTCITKLYQNNQGYFTDIQAGLPGIIDGEVAFIDYDLDMDLDIFITGKDINGNKYARLWGNNSENYTITNDLFVNVYFSQFDWGDFNGDGYPDLILGGYDGVTKSSMIYINNSGVDFSLSDVKVPGAQKGRSGFGDVDNDGDLDVFISGSKDPLSLNGNIIFINDGSDLLKPSSFTIAYYDYSNFQFGDYDNDNDLDIILNGQHVLGNGVTAILENTSSTLNFKPTAPSNLNVKVTGTQVLLTWNPGTDNNTPQKSLTYNIYMGTTSEGIDIISPHSAVSSGFRKISKQGYIQDTAWLIKNLPAGTYYWGVQTLDNSFAASAFSVENSFEIKNRFTETVYSESPHSTSPATFFDCDHDGDYDMVLTGDDEFVIAKNEGSGFLLNNYDTIYSEAFNPINTISPNDYDNNNLTDFSISGDYTVNNMLDSSITLFSYKNDFDYKIVDSAIVKNVDFEYVLWIDLNNDGLQDIITSGKTTNLGIGDKPVTYIYQNKGNGSFAIVSHEIRGFKECGAVAGDFDNDLDIDIIIYGKDSTSTPIILFYKNNADFNFIEEQISGIQLFRSVKSNGIIAGDYDLNGELDIYLSGSNVQNDFYAKVLLNNNLAFTDANPNLVIRSWQSMSNFWTDYDYDGDLDIFSTSTFDIYDETKLYLNSNGLLKETTVYLGATQLLELPFMVANLDNQNGLDFLMKINGGDYVQFYDNYATNKKLSTAPINLDYERSDLDLIFKWDRLPDCPGCTYNIRVGTHHDSVNIMSPMADLTTGFRYVIQPGNTYLNNRWKLTNLPANTYYWSVQAIDLANEGGPWAEMDTIVLTNVNPEFIFDTICFGDTTHFYDLSVATDNVVGWKWNFGDGSASTFQNPWHIYSTADTFNVSLWAYSESGDSSSQNHDIIVMNIPEVSFSADLACQGTSTNFTNSTNINGLNISNWFWDFGDSKYSTIESPVTHDYSLSGNYNVQLSALADNGCSDSIQYLVTVASYPFAVISSNSPLTFCDGDSTTLSVDHDVNNNYQWLLDDAEITDADSSKFVAKLTGNYKARVTNTIGNCITVSSGVEIDARSAPVAPYINYTGMLEFCQDDSVILNGTYNSDLSYRWKLNGGVIGADTNIYVAKFSGRYTLETINSTGCSVESSNFIDITVNDNPAIPSINRSGPTDFCSGDSLVISVTNNPAYSYQWRNEYGDIEGATSIKITSKESGTFYLKVFNSNGCFVESESTKVNVFESPVSPVIAYLGSTTFCNGDSIQLSVTNNPDLTYQWFRDGGDVGNTTSSLYAKATGDYTLKVTNVGGCYIMASNSVNVTINELPDKPVISLSGSTGFCEGDSLILSADEQENVIYQWSNEQGEILNANLNQYITYNSGNYFVGVSNSSNCTNTSSITNVSVSEMPPKPVITTTGYDIADCPQEKMITLSIDQATSQFTYQWKRNGVAMDGIIESKLEDYLKEGDYSVIADNSGCFNESDVIGIYYDPELPEKPSIIVNGPNVWYFACTIEDAIQYEWYYNNEIISGAGNYLYVANQNLGTYFVKIAEENGCFVASDSVTIPTTSTGIESPNPFANLKIYPNPTPGVFTIEMNNNLFGDLITRIFSQNAVEILNITFDKSTHHFKAQVDLSGQGKGMYIISLILDKYKAERKLVVE